MDYRTAQSKQNELLNILYEGHEPSKEALGVDLHDFTIILETATESNFITGASIIKTKTGNVIWTDKIKITELGAEKIHPTKTEEAISQTFNFNSSSDLRGSSFGNHNIVNNTWNTSLNDLKDYFATLTPTEQQTGQEIIEAIESQDFKPTVFKRFTSFLEDHTNAISMIGKAIVWSLTNLPA